MSEQPQIHLTAEDLEAGSEAVSRCNTGKILPAAHIVLEIVKAINAQRGGDPAGTIRRCDYGNGTSAVAVRVCGEDGAHYWKVTHPSGDTDDLDGPLADGWRLVVNP